MATQPATGSGGVGAPATKPKPKSRVDEVVDNMLRQRDQFKAALPPQIDVDKFVRVAITALRATPDLVEAEISSLYGAFMKAAQDGLLPDGREAHISMFNKKDGDRYVKVAQYQPMFTGLLKKVRNSGELASITAQIVCKNDKFDRWTDTDGEHIKHVADMFTERGEPIGAYALAKMKDGAVYIDVMTLKEIDKVRQVSRAKDNGPWKAWWDEMAKKSVLRRLCKRLPMSTDLEQAVRHDDETVDLAETEAAPIAETSRRLADAVGAGGGGQGPQHMGPDQGSNGNGETIQQPESQAMTEEDKKKLPI